MMEDGQLYEHVEEMTEDEQKYEHNKMFEELCGIKRETITVVSLLFINLVIHCHFLALRNCVFSTQLFAWFDALYGVKPDLKSHTSGCM